MLWDRGTWTPEEDPHEGYRRGVLKFTLHGEKLRGSFSLVRMGRSAGRARNGRENWLLIKHADTEARRGTDAEITKRLPDSVATGRGIDDIAAGRDRVWHSNKGRGTKTAPAKRSARAPRAKSGSRTIAWPAAARRRTLPAAMEAELATLVGDVPAAEGWAYEIKFDGYRLLARLDRRKATLITRNGKDWTDRFPTLAQAVAGLPAKQLVIDGELVKLDAHGRSSFQDLQNALRAGHEPELVFFAFDLLYLDGRDLRDATLLERKQLLEQLLVDAASTPTIRYSDHVLERGRAFFQQACRHGLEGIIAKRADSRYREGRTREWLKIKCGARQELVIGGFTEPKGSRAGIGALLLGVYEDGALRYAGRVGTGFSAHLLVELHEKLAAHERPESPFTDPHPLPRAAQRGVHWVAPKLVAEVAFTGWTDDGRLRHPSFQGLREDKDPREIVRETPSTRPASKTAHRRAAAPRSVRATRKAAGSSSSAVISDVPLTHPERVLYPEQGITKLELAQFYESIATRMLPHVEQRPLTLVRCPSGRGQKCFYQKHAGELTPHALGTVAIREDKTTADYLFVRSPAGLIDLVQMGVLEIHTWGSTVKRLEQPDRLVFDLDPGPGVDWKRVVEAARMVRARLDALGLQSFVKTTGGKGLHVAAPIVPDQTWDDVKSFARQLAESWARDAPDDYVATMSKAKRTGKIFIDYLRNARGATAIAAYSTRARAGAPVATPLRWEELGATDAADIYNVRNLPRRIARLRADPWADYFTVRQRITRRMRDRVG